MTATENAISAVTQFNLSFTSDFNMGLPVVYLNVPDESSAPQRYNIFTVDLAPFDEHPNGFYTYVITDQDGKELERGKMKLEGATTTPTQYQGEPVKNVTYGD